jgi:hypothetical protein
MSGASVFGGNDIGSAAATAERPRPATIDADRSGTPSLWRRLGSALGFPAGTAVDRAATPVAEPMPPRDAEPGEPDATATAAPPSLAAGVDATDRRSDIRVPAALLPRTPWAVRLDPARGHGD